MKQRTTALLLTAALALSDRKSVVRERVCLYV